MTNDAVSPSEIWVRGSEIWSDFAESAPRAKSAVWIFGFDFKGLGVPFRFWRPLSEICSKIWNSPVFSVCWSRFQISENSPLKG